jgi:serine/threonine protein kinase
MSDSHLRPTDLAQARRIEPVCLAFEAAWKQKTAPSLQVYLHRVSAVDRPALLRELILLEAHYRRRRGETIGAAEYEERFPELDREWLRQAVAAAQPMTTDLSGAQKRASVEPVPATLRYTGNYDLGEELGRGGMGVVYRAHDPDLSRTLAVKILLETHADNEELKRRFLEEAQIMGQLQHPGVAPIHEIGTLEDGRPFFSMKQIKGQTLAELLKRPGSEPEASARERSTAFHRLGHDLSRFLAYFEPVCQTLAFAHSRGILHRDLKPGNVMVGSFGEVQVMDWGLAKVLGAQSGGSQPTEPATPDASTIFTARTSSLDGAETAPGRVLGTPAYMAPEQARGEIEKLDERADVFGLGAILCEILTGQPPFPGDTQMDSHRKAMKSDLCETFARLNGCGADTELVDLAKRCLAAEKEDRPRQAADVAVAVARYQARVRERLRQAEVDRALAQVKAAEERRRRRVWVMLAGLAVLFVAAASGAAVWYYQDQADKAMEDFRKAQKKENLELNMEKEFVAVARQRDGLHQQLANPVTACQLLSDIDGWKARVDKMREAWERAQLLAESGKDLLDDSWLAQLEMLDGQIGSDEKNWTWAKKLDEVRLKAAALVEGKWSPTIAARLYPPLFVELGLDVEKGPVDQAAAQIGKSPIRYALVAALDDWAEKIMYGAGWTKASTVKLQVRGPCRVPLRHNARNLGPRGIG